MSKRQLFYLLKYNRKINFFRDSFSIDYLPFYWKIKWQKFFFYVLHTGTKLISSTKSEYSELVFGKEKKKQSSKQKISGTGKP